MNSLQKNGRKNMHNKYYFETGFVLRVLSKTVDLSNMKLYVTAGVILNTVA